ncbi:ATP-binding protein [Verrucomicrobiales bacterium BCK34]|nr:ATP-binding protein [Verrucomicrobiales bacterium BCK34]
MRNDPAYQPPEGRPLRRWQACLGVDEVWVQGQLSSRLFLSLRWIALVGQSLTLLIAERFDILIPWSVCLSVLGFTLFSNAFLEWWNRVVKGELGSFIFHVALWDLISLTILLYGLGGLDNPFAIFYLVQLTVVTVALRYEGIAGLTIAAVIACGVLWFYHEPLVLKNGADPPREVVALGRFVALILAGATILILIVAVRSQSLALRQERERLHQKLEAQDRFLSVATLATGFAHELATPLGTISIAASELAKEAEENSLAATIQRESARCERVLNRLRDVGQEAVEGAAPDAEVGSLVEEALALLPGGQRSRIVLSMEEGIAGLIRSAGICEALLVVLRNALQSSPPGGRVEFTVTREGGFAAFEVLDEGSGFSSETLLHWAEPFFTTRDEGLGLGLFFVRRLVTSQAGEVTIENRSTGGAAVCLRLPLSVSTSGKSE